MSFLRSKAFWTVSAAVGAIATIPAMNGIFHTPATKQVAEAFSAGGGTHTHTPAVATPRGKRNEIHQHREGEGGLGSKHFHENFAAQRPDPPNPIAKKFNEAFLGMSTSSRWWFASSRSSVDIY
ncbi:hypothetical protein BKA80DRAFT_266151 [Phyllosticta citrichinensis]